MNWQQLYTGAKNHNIKSIARCISVIENETEGANEILKALPMVATSKIVGITGPPGAGKSTLTDGLIGEFVRQGKKVAVLCVDPSSPFHFGALLGDRIRMSDWYTHPNVYIRSFASRGSLGGLHPRLIEITDFLCRLDFDLVIVETVGVGQSEVEIAGLADCTVVVLVPEAGDEVQTMKAGLMEIADVFVINKADRPEADQFAYHLHLLVHDSNVQTPVIKTIASKQTGIKELADAIVTKLDENSKNDRKYWLLAERAYQLMRDKKMKNISKEKIKLEIIRLMNENRFNLYKFASDYEKL